MLLFEVVLLLFERTLLSVGVLLSERMLLLYEGLLLLLDGLLLFISRGASESNFPYSRILSTDVIVVSSKANFLVP